MCIIGGWLLVQDNEENKSKKKIINLVLVQSGKCLVEYMGLGLERWRQGVGGCGFDVSVFTE